MPTRTSLDVRYCTQAAGGVLRGLDMTLAQAGRTLRFSPVPSHCLARHRCLAHAMCMPSTCLPHAHSGSVPPRFIVLAWHLPYAWGRVRPLASHNEDLNSLNSPTYRLTHSLTYPLTHLLTADSAAMARATLVVSYWSAPSSNLSWFDQPPCEAGGQGQDACGETVRLSKLSLRPGPFKPL
eukprot:scaffold129010_cov69-Phaeocystis_antarctica.AAC.3